jgi:hypothetical protein
MRLAIVFIALSALAAGCQRAGSGSKPAAGTAPAAKQNDLRTLTMAEVEFFLQSKLHEDGIELTSGANGKYKGTRKSPDGTAVLPLEVTVEADRVICEIRTPAGSSRDIVPLEGEIKSELNVK